MYALTLLLSLVPLVSPGQPAREATQKAASAPDQRHEALADLRRQEAAYRQALARLEEARDRFRTNPGAAGAERALADARNDVTTQNRKLDEILRKRLPRGGQEGTRDHEPERDDGRDRDGWREEG